MENSKLDSMEWYRTKWFTGAVFILIFACLYWIYSYNLTFAQPPQSVHTWRQTNSLSMTQIYYQDRVPFAEPEIHNRISDDGLSGKTAGEFPIIYYLVAKIWTFTGQSEWIFRFLHYLLLMTGSFLLFRMVEKLTGNAIIAGFVGLLAMTSPMVIFYGPNFLPDAPSLAFVLIAWYFLHAFVQQKKMSALWLSALFFFLAISLKITAATSFIAIGGWVLLENIFLPSGKRIFNFRLRHYLPFVVAVGALVIWYAYVYYYTGIHKGSFSYMGIWPVWKMTAEQFHRITDTLDKIWFREFFWPPLQYTTLAIWLFMLTQWKKLPLFLCYMLVIMPLGLAGILALWFQVLEGHDYYLITQIQTLLVIWIAFFLYLKERKQTASRVVNIVLVMVLVTLVLNGQKRHSERYSGWMNEGYKLHFEALTTIQPFFAQWGISEKDLVISLPDPSINASLYYMNRKGYTDFASDFSKEETFVKRIAQGAKYLVVNDTTILSRPEVARFAKYPAGQYLNVKVFDLRPFSPENRND